MASKTWVGGAAAVAQVSSASIDSVDTGSPSNTFTVTIGGVEVSTEGVTDVATTAANLVTALEASTHPYFTAVDWTNPSGGTITGTAATAGVPFVAELSVSGGGTGTVTDFAEDTASAGPNDASTALNWSDGAIPANGDTVVLKDSAVPIAYGLDQNGVTLAELIRHETYTGKVGLLTAQFATSVDGATTVTTAREYRQSYWKIGADVVRIGEHLGPGSPNGSQRFKLEQAKSGASTITVLTTAANGETNLPAVRVLASSASCNVYVRGAPGGVGLGADAANETATFGDIYMESETTSDSIFVGPGVTFSNYFQTGGDNVLQFAAKPTKIECNGGNLQIEADQAITTLEVNDGNVVANNVPPAASPEDDAIDTVTHNGGNVDLTQSSEPRSIGVYTPASGAELSYDSDVITFGSFNVADGRRVVTWE